MTEDRLSGSRPGGALVRLVPDFSAATFEVDDAAATATDEHRADSRVVAHATVGDGRDY